MKDQWIRKHRTRSKRGAAIAEGAAMLPLIILVCVTMILFLLWAGFNIYYRVKLSFIAGNVANYAAAQLKGDGSDADQAVLHGLGDVVQELQEAVGLPTITADAKITPATTSSSSTSSSTSTSSSSDTATTPAPMVTIKLSMDDIQFFNGTLPAMTINETGAAVIKNGGSAKPDGYMVLSILGSSGQSFGIPCYASGKGGCDPDPSYDGMIVGSWRPGKSLHLYGSACLPQNPDSSGGN